MSEDPEFRREGMSHMRRYITCPPIILLVLAIQGCGGGGGGGGGGGNAVTIPPPSPSTIISTGNAYDAVSVGIVLSEAVTQISLATFNPVIDLIDDGSLSLNVACPSGGSRTVSIVDNDGSQGLSTADDLTVTWTSCFSGEMNGTVAGTFNIAVTDYWTNDVADTYLAGTLSFSDVGVSGDADLTTDGTFDIEILATHGFEVFEIKALGGNVFSVTIDANGSMSTETVNSVDLLRTTARQPGTSDLVYSLTSALSFDSEILSESLSCITPRALRSTNANHEPLEGEFRCSASDGSRARFDSDRPNRDSAITLEVDAQGNGGWMAINSPDGNPVHWQNVVEGELFTMQFNVANAGLLPGPDEVTPLRVSLSTNDMIYSPTTDRLFATNNSALMEINPATLSVTRSLALPDTPGAIALSDDGSTLWVALDGTGILQRIDTATLTMGSTLALGDGVNPPLGLRVAVRLRVAPGSTDVVVAATRYGEMLAFANGALLPNRIDETMTTFSSPTLFLFRDASTIVAADGTSTAYTAFRITLDTTTGLSLVSERSGLSNQSSDRLKLGGEYIYASRGAVFDERTNVRITSVPPHDGFYDDLDVDVDDSLIIGFRNATGGRYVEVVDESTHQHIGSYRLPLTTPSQRFENVVQTDTYVVARQDSDLISIPKSDLARNVDGVPCVRLDLSALVVSGTHATVQCGITNITYDRDRGLIYASLDGKSSEGHAIAVLGDTDLAEVDYIRTPFPVGATTISSDGTVLYGILPLSNRYIEIDLDTRIMTAEHALGVDTFEPFVGNSVAATRGADGDVIISMGGEVAVFDDGAILGGLADPNASYDAIHVSSDGAKAFGQDFNRLDELSITSSGAVIIQEGLAEIYPQPAASRNDTIYGVDGRFFGMASGLVSDGCFDAPILTSPWSRIGAAPDSDELHYAWIADPVINNHMIFVLSCNANTLQFGSVSESPVFAVGDANVEAVLSLGSRKIVVLTDDGALVMLDTPPAN